MASEMVKTYCLNEWVVYLGKMMPIKLSNGDVVIFQMNVEVAQALNNICKDGFEWIKIK